MQEDGPGTFVRKVAQDTHRYSQELLEENRKLRVLLATLEAERQSLSTKARLAKEAVASSDALKALVDTLETEKQRLQEQLLRAQEELEHHRQDQHELRTRLVSTEAETREFAERYAHVEDQNSKLANLYVASYQLHGTVDFQEVVTVIREIVANLIGSEELALFKMSADGSALELVASFGIEAELYRKVFPGEGAIGRAIQSGEIYVAGTSEAEDAPAVVEPGLTAAIPLQLDGRVTGALAVFRLLPQKPGVEDADRELFELLASHAATALHCARLHAGPGQDAQP